VSENYKPESGAANSWLRCNHIECNNGHGQVPSIRFDEERRVVLADGQSFGQPTHSITAAFTAPSAELPLYDPTTGQLTGQSVTDGMVYAVLYSLYMRTALQADAGQQAEL
jgi:hypothetical protein